MLIQKTSPNFIIIRLVIDLEVYRYTKSVPKNHGVGSIDHFQFLNNSKRNARQPGQLPDSCPKGESVS